MLHGAEMGKKKSWTREALEIAAAFAAAWLFYQFLAIAAGTSTPVVSVASQSMFHENGFDEWWEDHGTYYGSTGISKEEFQSFTNRNGLGVGDMLLVVRSKNLSAGDIIVYHPQRGCFSIDETIVHRIVRTEGGTHITKGDANAGQDKCPVEQRQIEGKALVAVPLLGYPRLALRIFGI